MGRWAKGERAPYQEPFASSCPALWQSRNKDRSYVAQRVSTAGNDANPGTNKFFPKLTIEAAVNAAGTGGNVIAGEGTYTISAALKMEPGVHLSCNDGATITQGNSQNLPELIDFNTNAASGAWLVGCTIDGNRANNTDGLNSFWVFAGAANNVVIESNTIKNCSGMASTQGPACVR